MIGQTRAPASGSGFHLAVAGRRAGLALVAVAAALAAPLFSSPALAANKYVPVAEVPAPSPGNQTWTPTSFNSLRAESVAVSDKNGHLYVADSGRGAIYDFESISDETPTKWTGSTTPKGSFGGSFLSVAVDNATGDVYVASRPNAVINKFDDAGNLIESFGDTTPSPNGQLVGSATPAGSFLPPGTSYSSFGIVVNQATHDLYVLDSRHKVIDIFDETGAYLSQITATPAGLYRENGNYATGIAVNGLNSHVYVADWAGPNLVTEFDSAGNYVSTWDGSNTPDGNLSGTCTGCYLSSVTTEDATGHVFVGSMAHHAIDVFDDTGAFLSPQVVAGDYVGSELIPNPLSYVAGVTIDQATGYLYESDSNRVQIYRPVIVPDVSVNAASGVAATDATLTGHIDPAGGGGISDCHFEYISDDEFRQNGQADPWKGASEVLCQTSPPSSPPYPSATDVQATATGLAAGAIYHFRLAASNTEGVNRAVGSTFATLGEYEFSTSVGSAGSGDGQLEEPGDVAVDSSSGDIYVADTGNHRVVKFDGTGSFEAAWGWGVADGSPAAEVCTSGCQPGIAGSGGGQFETPRYIEVDNSGGLSAHDVYVADSADGVVQKFTADGSPIDSWGAGGAIDFSDNGQVAGMTVSAIGDLFVVGAGEGSPWTRVGQDGISRSELETGSFFGLGAPNGGGIEVDQFGGYYETQQGGQVNYRNPEGQAYSGHGVYPSWYGGQLGSGVALNRVSGDLYVDQADHIDQFLSGAGCVSGAGGGLTGSSSCGPQDSFGFGELAAGSGLAFNETSGRIYAADEGSDRIAVFDPQPTPTVVSGPATNIAATSGTVTGHVQPAGSEDVTTCRFEYGPDTSYDLGSVPCAPGGPLSSGTDVSAELTGLAALTTYHYRLVASGDNGILRWGQDRSFTPAGGTPPLVTETASSGISPTSATLTAQINPMSAPTIYRFQYGATPAYGSQTPMSEPIGEDETGHAVSQPVTDLQPGITYHFRVVAVNYNGVAPGPDEVFNTPDAPVVLDDGVSAITQTTATLHANVKPGFSPTTVRFEYGPTLSYGQSVGGQAGSDNQLHGVSTPVSGLSPGTTYHVRVIAENAIDQALGPEVTFTTASPEVVQPKTPKPACRRGFARRHGRCVRRRRRGKHHHHHHRHEHRGGHRGRSNGHG